MNKRQRKKKHKHTLSQITDEMRRLRVAERALTQWLRFQSPNISVWDTPQEYNTLKWIEPLPVMWEQKRHPLSAIQTTEKLIKVELYKQKIHVCSKLSYNNLLAMVKYREDVEIVKYETNDDLRGIRVPKGTHLYVVDPNNRFNFALAESRGFTILFQAPKIDEMYIPAYTINT